MSVCVGYTLLHAVEQLCGEPPVDKYLVEARERGLALVR
jgi:hypothetical protein